MLGLMGLTGCATVHPSPTANVSFLCVKPIRPDEVGLTVGQLTSFSIAQEGTITCFQDRGDAYAKILQSISH